MHTPEGIQQRRQREESSPSTKKGNPTCDTLRRSAGK
jgi:hypothetical protein